MNERSNPLLTIINGFVIGANGRVDMDDGTVSLFVGAVPVDVAEELTVGVSSGPTKVYNGGTASTAAGKLIYVDLQGEPLPATARFTDGFAHTDSGKLFVDSTSPIIEYAHGVPLVASGAVAVEALIPPATVLTTQSGDLLITQAGDFITTKE